MFHTHFWAIYHILVSSHKEVKKKKRKQSATHFFPFLSIILKAQTASKPVVFPNTFVAEFFELVRHTKLVRKRIWRDTRGRLYWHFFPLAFMGPQLFNKAAQKLLSYSLFILLFTLIPIHLLMSVSPKMNIALKTFLECCLKVSYKEFEKKAYIPVN